jgi:hypothetical protein
MQDNVHPARACIGLYYLLREAVFGSGLFAAPAASGGGAELLI